MNISNLEIREAMIKARIRHYELARALDVHTSTLSRWLRYELPEEKKQTILKAIRAFK